MQSKKIKMIKDRKEKNTGLTYYFKIHNYIFKYILIKYVY